MREYKFRAWDKEQKQMLYDGFCIIPTSPSWSATKYFTPKEFELDPEKWFDCTAFDWADGLMMTGNYELMQYTGLLDKNNKEIYEGDILKTDEADWVGKVTYSQGAFILLDNKGGFSTEPNWRLCEVIGNIYEPKLEKQ